MLFSSSDLRVGGLNPSGRAMFLNDLHAAVCSSLQFVSTLIYASRFDRSVLLVSFRVNLVYSIEAAPVACALPDSQMCAAAVMPL